VVGGGAVVVAVRPNWRERDRCGICRRRSHGFDLGEGRRRWRALDLGTTFAYVGAEAPRVSCRRSRCRRLRGPVGQARVALHPPLRGSGLLAGGQHVQDGGRRVDASRVADGRRDLRASPPKPGKTSICSTAARYTVPPGDHGRFRGAISAAKTQALGGTTTWEQVDLGQDRSRFAETHLVGDFGRFALRTQSLHGQHPGRRLAPRGGPDREAVLPGCCVAHSVSKRDGGP
jgi:hypothetical protein